MGDLKLCAGMATALLLASCTQAAEVQAARSAGFDHVVESTRAAFVAAHPEVTVTEPQGGWEQAATSAMSAVTGNGLGLDARTCYNRLWALAESQIAHDHATAELYTTGDFRLNSIATATNYNGLPAADVAQASIIWAGANALDLLAPRTAADDIEMTTRGLISDLSRHPPTDDNEVAPPLDETMPPGTQNEESFASSIASSALRESYRSFGRFPITAEDVSCMQHAGLALAEAPPEQ